MMTAGGEASPVIAKRAGYRLFTAAVFSISLLFGHAAAAHTRTHGKSVTHHVATHHFSRPASHATHGASHRLVSAGSRRITHMHYAAVSRRSPYHAYYRYARNGYSHRLVHYASAQYRHSYLQCVPYAREVSHIDLSGNAFLWWAEAAGRYARGSTPQEGAVLNFRSIGRMPLGHVAVVTSVIDNRDVLVTQANWVRGTITNDVTITDVSPDNDWTQVQVQLGDGEKMGAAYPTYGFIYNQPDNGGDTGTVIAAATTAAQGNEVAEAPRPAPVATDAPDRNLQ